MTDTHWTILGPAPRQKGVSPHVLARCSCGRERAVMKHDIVSGKSRSCGCVHGQGLAPEARFHAKYRKTASGCWQWLGRLSTDGYGRIDVGGRALQAHRFSWTLHRGEIPDGCELDHLCRNRACVNPDHLEPVTHRDNVLRGTGPSAQHARKTHCKRNHEFTPANTYVEPNRGARHCRACRASRKQERATTPP